MVDLLFKGGNMSKSAHFGVINLFLLSLFLVGCTESLIYSPSMNLPPRPLKGGQSQFLAGAGYFPETRPFKSPEKTAYGGEATFRFALCEHFSIQAKGWKDFSDNFAAERIGLSGSVIAMLNDSSNFRYGIMPTGALLFGGGELDGGGGGIPICFWFTRYHPIDIYATITPAFGIKDIAAEKKQWGWGVLLNAGTAIIFNDCLTLNLEFSGIKQVNEYEGRKDYFICPSLNIGYFFRGQSH